MSNFFDAVVDILRQDERFFSPEGELLRNAVYACAMKMDARLIRLLYENEATRARFFTDVDGIAVFDKVGFGWVVNNREFLPDSYTRYKNRIGLTDARGGYLAASGDVELAFPYKDCVLEGGQTKEDQRRTEIFYNETLAPDEIDRLLAPKVLAGAVRYAPGGAAEGDVQFHSGDNLVIQGNNLLAIASLLPVYEGKVRLIYIDPPYNTGTDSFSYNDRFSRSAWLTFLKTRLQLARRLLAPDGAIYVQLDYHQAHYAKVLMDEIFGEENFQREIIWRIGWLSGYKTADNNWIRNHDTILFYSKSSDQLRFFKNYIPRAEFKDIAKGNAERYPIEDVWNASEYDDLNSIAIVSFSGETVSKMLQPGDEVKGQKSEKLLERILKAHTQPGDLVLDFFGGTGTTAAAALKTGRRFILCEQLDKHVDIILRRLQKVMDGEQSGISKPNGWRGGGSFVYCRLAELNAAYMDRIQDASDPAALGAIWADMQTTGLISCRVDPCTVDPAAVDFAALSLADQKRLLCELLDKNQLYVNLCDLDDASYAVREEDKRFTKSFYGEG